MPPSEHPQFPRDLVLSGDHDVDKGPRERVPRGRGGHRLGAGADRVELERVFGFRTAPRDPDIFSQLKLRSQ